MKLDRQELTAVILAAGKGTRMKSSRPKVLHQVCGRYMLEHVLYAAREAGANQQIVVVGYQGETIKQEINFPVEYVNQYEQLGTGHAVMQAKEKLKNFGGSLLVLCGDTPMLTAETLRHLWHAHQEEKAAATILTAILPDATGYGRIVRQESGSVCKIVEQRDATVEEKKIKEINTGTYCFDGTCLLEALDQLTPENDQGEYYLTDVIEIFVREGLKVQAFPASDPIEVKGVNNRVQLAESEVVLRERICKKLMLQGVTIMDPACTYIDMNVKVGQDTIIYPGVLLEGQTEIGKECIIGPQTRIVDSIIGDGVEIMQSFIRQAQIGSHNIIGPYAYVRPETQTAEAVKIGGFVEVKKSSIGKGSKVPHLSYVGDTKIGENVNIGAGTIVCNYDGKAKHQTLVEDGAFIGSNSNLVAPVVVGKNAVTAAGSTITENVPGEALGIARNRQTNIEDWVKRRK